MTQPVPRDAALDFFYQLRSAVFGEDGKRITAYLAFFRITVTLYHLHYFHNHNRRSCLLRSLNYDSAQRVRQPDAKLRPALRAWPQFGAGCR